MCKSPISVPNPHYNRIGYVSQFGDVIKLSSDFSSSKQFIEVPCGKCSDCRDSYFNSILQRAICESRSSYMYFVTLTYDDSHIPYIDLDSERVLYADYSHIQSMIKRFRASGSLNREFRYLCVNEYGDRYSRPHFHLLFFVAKSKYDNDSTPYLIEKVLYDNLKIYFAENVGTRKHPIYEPLFTYRERITPFGLRSNYWVKYVASSLDYDSLKVEDESSQIRAIRYLISYVNTNTCVDSSISSFLGNHAHDPILCKRVKCLLANRVRFSKGFGCGFVDGEKFYLPRISVRASSNVLYFSNMFENLPKHFEDFEELYPELAEQLLDFISDDLYSRYSSLKDALQHFTVDDFHLHLLTVRYFPKHISLHFHNLYKDDFIPTVATCFDMLRPYSYSIKRVKTYDLVDSDLVSFLRQGVEEGFSHSLPFIAFPIKSSSGYVALCKFYRDRVTTIEDLRRMYDSCGVSDYDAWRDLFIKSYNTRKGDKALANSDKFEKNVDVIFENQKKSLHLLRRSDKNMFHSVFVH